jgi:AcrR family transcriptional regulator
MCTVSYSLAAINVFLRADSIGGMRKAELTQRKPQTRGQARRQAMLDAAAEVFLEKGFERTSLSDIVDRSGGSRSTLYEQFGNKEGLLRAMIEQVTGEVWELVAREKDAGPFTEEGLVDLGIRFLRAALAPKGIAVFRILVAEGSRLPEIARYFYERGPRTIDRLLAESFAHSLEARKDSGSPEQLAQVFLGAVLGILHLRRVLGLHPVPTEEEIRAQATVAVRIFLGGVESSRTP